MIKQTLATSLFTAGMLLSGAAMAQTRPPLQARPMEERPMQARPMQQPPVQPPMQHGMENGPAWQGSEQNAIRIGTLYTDALNTLYAHGFYNVHHMRMNHGGVVATAVTPNGRMRHVTVQPQTHQIQLGVG